MTSYNREWLTFSAHQKPTVGDSKFSAVNCDHMGWLLCDGRLLSVNDFVWLFDVIGYSFGGSGTQFNLPNPTGRVPGVITNPNVAQIPDPNMSTIASFGGGGLGSTIGEYEHTLTIPEMPIHDHTINDPGHVHTGQTNEKVDTPESESAGPGSSVVVSGSNQRYLTFTTNSSTTGITINNTGGSQAHNNVQPIMFMGNMFIYSGKVAIGNYPYTSGPSPITYNTTTTAVTVFGSNVW